MTNHRLLTVFSVLLLAMLACARGSTPTAAPAPTIPPATRSFTPSPGNHSTRTPAPLAMLPGVNPGLSRHALSFGGIQRDYLLYVPASADLGKPAPLVFAFHGGTGNAENFMQTSGLNAVADQHGFLVVYPNGTGRLGIDKLLTWNGGTCCGYAQTENIDDVGFVRSLLASLRSLVSIDPRRIYASGFSNGAILAQRLACEATDIFAAVAPVSGTLNFGPCTPDQPISLIEFHGTADPNILYTGGYGPESIVRVNFSAVADTLKFWSNFDGCGAPSRSAPMQTIQLDTWTGCSGGVSVELYTLEGGKHAWPVSPLAASQVIWEFFAAHPKP